MFIDNIINKFIDNIINYFVNSTKILSESIKHVVIYQANVSANIS
jgi:hypothetical protein